MSKVPNINDYVAVKKFLRERRAEKHTKKVAENLRELRAVDMAHEEFFEDEEEEMNRPIGGG